MLLNFIYPPKCLLCKIDVSKDHTFCRNCFLKLNFITIGCEKCGRQFFEDYGPYNKVCYVCKARKYFFEKARSILVYDQYSKPLIHDYKFRNRRNYKVLLTKLLNIITQDLLSKIDLITCVPVHYFRLLTRGYNQSAFLARMLALHNRVAFDVNLLKKTRYTKSQHKIDNRAERLRNLNNVFKVRNNAKIENKNILLVDDVMTTGATVNECAKTLMKNGVKKVFVVTVASTLIFNQN